MSRYINSITYKQAVIDAKEYTDNDFLGFTTYLGSNSSDKVYPTQFNFQNSLLLQIAEKLSKLEERVDKATDNLKMIQPTGQIVKKCLSKYW